MNAAKTILGVMLLASGVAGHAQNAGAHQAVKSVRSKPKTQEQLLLEQLTDKFEKIDQLTEKYDDLQRRFDAMQKQLEAVQKAAAAAGTTQKLEATQPASNSEGGAITQLKSDVADLKTTSASLVTAVDRTQKKTEALESPDVIHLKGITLKPGGFIAAETVDRQRANGSDVNTQFSAIPFAGQSAGVLSEFNAGGRQSRLSLMAEGKLPRLTLRAYYEADFLSAGTTSNDNQSNSYTLRQRQAWAQAEWKSGWTLTAGQMWSLATEYRSGLSNTEEAIPMTVDAQYNVGFTWERQYGFRVVKKISDRFWIGGAIEEAQTLNIGGHNLPTILYQQAGNGAGLYNPTANYSYNYVPDLIAKIVYEPRFGHFEIFGIGRFFRDRVFPNGPLPVGAPQPPVTSALDAFTSKAQGGGIGVNGRVSLFAKKLDIGAHILAGNGMGRYSTSALPDATAHPDGSLALLVGGSALGSLEWHANPRLDVYAYYGGEYAKRAYYATGYFVTTPGPTQGQPILAGYGAPNNIVSGCYLEVLPVSSPNGGGNVPGAPANCMADNRNIQEGTFGYWFRFYKGTRGTFQQGLQYSYVERHTWQGIGDPLTGLAGSPKGIDNMLFTSFRYYLP